MKNKIPGVKLVLLLLCFCTFILYAMYFNGFGANAQATMGFFRIDEAQNGMIMTIQSIGCIVVTIILGLFGERLNKINGIVFGLCFMGLAGICIGLLPAIGGGYLMMLIFSLIAGVGFITIDLLMNSVVADVFPDKKEILLPYVHAFYGAGAMLAPVFITALVDPAAPATFARPYLLIGVFAVLVCVVLFFVGKRVAPMTPYADMTVIRNRARSNPAEIFRDPKAWLFLLSCFLYLIFQTGITTWLPTYCTEVMEYGFTASGLMVTVYFLGALVMRFLSPLIYKKLGVRRFYMLSLLVSAVVFLVFLLLPMPDAAAVVLIGVVGLLQGASVPSLVILCCDTFPTRTASASSVVVLGVSLAAMVAPPVMGFIMEAFGYLPAMLIITACLIFSVILLPREKLFKAK